MERLLLVTVLLTVIFCGCTGSDTGNASKPFPPELVSFAPYEGNPVFAGTSSDTWDRMIRERGWILREDDGWHMWYTGYNNDLSDTRYPEGGGWTAIAVKY